MMGSYAWMLLLTYPTFNEVEEICSGRRPPRSMPSILLFKLIMDCLRRSGRLIRVLLVFVAGGA